MKQSFTRRIDELGRVVLPVELRRALDIEERDSLDIILEDDRLILRKSRPTCVFCGREEQLLRYRRRLICTACLRDLTHRDPED